jgi:hypothetical protein
MGEGVDFELPVPSPALHGAFAADAETSLVKDINLCSERLVGPCPTTFFVKIIADFGGRCSSRRVLPSP